MTWKIGGHWSLALLLLVGCTFDTGGATNGPPASSISDTTATSDPTETNPVPTETLPDPTQTTSQDPTQVSTTGAVDPDTTTGFTTTNFPETTSPTETDSETTTETTTGDSTTTTTDSTTTTGDGSSSTGDDTTGMPDTTGEPDSTGEPVPVLVDDELLVRYYLDEGEGMIAEDLSGVDPALDMDLTVVGEGNATNPAHAMLGDNRGQRWPMAGLDGRVSSPVMGTKIKQLGNTQQLTYEAVLDLKAATGNGSRIIHIGADQGSICTLRTPNNTTLEFYWRESNRATWPVNWGAGRTVIHLVVNTTLMPNNRVRLYVNGSLVQPTNTNMIPNNDMLPVPDMNGVHNVEFAIGNRGTAAGRSFEGILLYAAVYKKAFTAQDVSANHDVLTKSDDRP